MTTPAHTPEDVVIIINNGPNWLNVVHDIDAVRSNGPGTRIALDASLNAKTQR